MKSYPFTARVSLSLILTAAAMWAQSTAQISGSVFRTFRIREHFTMHLRGDAFDPSITILEFAGKFVF